MNSDTRIIPYGIEIPSRVFVGHIPYNMTDVELHEFFSQHGKVKDSKVITDRQGVSKGYGFVTFYSEEEAQEVLSQRTFRYKNSTLMNVRKAIRRQGGHFDQECNGQNDVSLLRHCSGDYLITFNNGMCHTEPLHHHSEMSKPYYSLFDMQEIPPSPGPLYLPTGFKLPPPLRPPPSPPPPSPSLPPWPPFLAPPPFSDNQASPTYIYYHELQDPSIVECGGVQLVEIVPKN